MKKNDDLLCVAQQRWKKTIRIMKLTVGLLLMTMITATAVNTYSQNARISLNVKDATILDIFREIERNSEFGFFYKSEEMNLEKRQSIEVSGATIDDILKKVLDENYSYKILDKNIVVTRGSLEGSQQQTRRVSGKVTDSSGATLPGVSVTVKGTTIGVITDNDGKYTLSSIPENATLQFSFVGMKMQEITVSGKTSLNVILEDETVGIEEVVAIGYGTQKKVNLTGAVEQVTATQLEKRSVTNVGQALQGVIPNLNVSVANGNPQTKSTYNIRGGTSFSETGFLMGSPLILVDGIDMDINNLNPDDIESISVIKDAAAAAIYGARGAYGVMLVTTKTGKKDKAPKISFSSTFQMQVPSNDPDLLNSVEYQKAFMNAKRLNNEVPNANDEKRLLAIQNYYDNPETAPGYFMNGNNIVWVANTNPWKEIVRDWAPTYQNNLSVSGGGNKTSYFASIGIQDQSGIMKDFNDSKKRYNGSLVVSSDITKWLNVDFKARYTRSVSVDPYHPQFTESELFWESMLRYADHNLFPPIFTPSDSPVGVMPTGGIINSINQSGIRRVTQAEDLVMLIAATIKIFKGLNFKTDFSYNANKSYAKAVVPIFQTIEYSWTSFFNPYNSNSYMYKRYSNTDRTLVNAYFDFSRTFKDKHNINATAGFNQELYKDNYLFADGQNLVNINVPVLGLTTGTKTSNDGESNWAIRGAFVRFNYVYDNKYLFEMNGRYDGTSKFSKNSRFQFFPSFSAGWRISEEPFMKEIKPVLTQLKVRASYGNLGNQDVDNYAYISTYGYNPKVLQIFNGSTPIGIIAPGLISSDLTWETASTLDFGIDATLYNKLTLNYDWYSRETRNILTSAEKLPSVLGAIEPKKNSGILKTNGWEASVRWSDRLNNGLNYRLSFVLSDYQSEIISFTGNPNNLISTLYEGRKMGEMWGYNTAGTFQTYEEIKNAPSQTKISSVVWRPGDIRYADLNSDNIIDNGKNTLSDPGDLRIIGNTTPRFQFGFNTDLSWHNFDFNMFWQGIGKRDFWTDSPAYWGMIQGTEPNGGIGTKWGYNNSWTTDRTDAFFPAYKRGDYNKIVQSKFLINAAYARLKNIAFGYTLPENITKHMDISKLRIYVSGFNLFSISKIPKVFDPELLSANYPVLQTYTVGLQVTF